MYEKNCDIDNFAVSLESIIGEVFDECSVNVSKAVEKTTKKGAKELRETYALRGIHDWSDEYREGFKASVKKSGDVATGEIGNRKKPGLVHLLEKGHLTITGRRTRSFPHMAPAFDEMKEEFVKAVGFAVDDALKG